MDLSKMTNREVQNEALGHSGDIGVHELVAFNEDQRRMLFDAAIKLEADRDRWKAIAEKRHAILLDLEWCKESDESYCPCCMAIDGETHIAGCKMAEAIAESARAANGGGE